MSDIKDEMWAQFRALAFAAEVQRDISMLPTVEENN